MKISFVINFITSASLIFFSLTTFWPIGLIGVILYYISFLLEDFKFKSKVYEYSDHANDIIDNVINLLETQPEKFTACSYDKRELLKYISYYKTGGHFSTEPHVVRINSDGSISDPINIKVDDYNSDRKNKMLKLIGNIFERDSKIVISKMFGEENVKSLNRDKKLNQLLK